MAKRGRAAFSRDDVEDAKRGYPDFDLRDHAARRGLEFLDHGHPGVRLELANGLLAVWSINGYWGNAMASDLDAFCASVAAVVDLRPGPFDDRCAAAT